LKRPQVTINDVFEILEIEQTDRAQKITIEADIKYDGFIHKQKKEIERQKRIEETKLPSDIDYNSIQGLLTESRGKLDTIRPLTIGQASRISGVTPADVSVLIMHIIRNK
jgi:tRNA uridine 5-carboxymethylaminomethyl modification enzyme